MKNKFDSINIIKKTSENKGKKLSPIMVNYQQYLKDQNKDQNNNNGKQHKNNKDDKNKTSIKGLESSLRRAEKEKIKREEEQRKIRIREEARQEEIG